MKRGVIDLLRRGLDNTIANWQLILIRLGETLIFAFLAIATVFAVLAPIIVSVGIRIADLQTPDDVAGAMVSLLDKWMILFWIFAAVTILFLLIVAIHSFVEAGCARVYVDGERIAGSSMTGLRSRYRVFSTQRWFAGGSEGWWTVFWIYNLAWGVAGLILLIPLLPTIVLMIVFREQPPAAIATGCIGLVLTLMLMIVVGIVTGMWTNRSIADWAVRHSGASAALSGGWAAMRADLARHLLVALAIIVVALAGSSFFAGFSFFAAFGEAVGSRDDIFALMTFPLRIAGSFFSSIFSAGVSSWYLAAYSALATERRAAAATADRG